MNAGLKGGAAAPRSDLAAARPPLRFVSAASLFDGHDAAINMIRRLLQARGAEVVHLGHNRSVADIVRAAIDEDADAIAVSSYQGGHNEYFAYMVDMLRERGCGHIRVVVGGGGTFAPSEIEALERHGIEKIYTPEDGHRLGLAGMIEDVLQRIAAVRRPAYELRPLNARDHAFIARTISVLEGAPGAEAQAEVVRRTLARSRHRSPVIGITGTGGAGKSSLTDELLARLVRQFPQAQIAVAAMDPTRRRSGGALLGDRIRINSLASENVFMRSLATRRAHLATAAVLKDVIALYQAAGFDLVLVETAGIGQSDTEIVDLVDLSLYVMTSEYGAASQLEKIDMLDFADFIVLNKAEKRGAEDSLRDVRKQWRRNHAGRAQLSDAELPVFATIASRFNDPGVNRLFAAICAALEARQSGGGSWKVADPGPTELASGAPLIPGSRTRYLAEIAEGGRAERARIEARTESARRAFGLYESLKALRDAALPGALEPFAPGALTEASLDATRRELRAAYNRALDEIGEEGLAELRAWPSRVRAATDATYSYRVRDRMVTGENYTESLSRLAIRRLAVPAFRDWGELLRFILSENLPGAYPYTGGVYPYRREEEDPTRMFAGEGGPERTNRRFHYLAHGHGPRLSTAFDSTTLYGEDPDTRPDIYGRTGNSGVSIATLDDMKVLYDGFNLCSPSTSVSMTINGPAPTILAMFMNTAIDQQVDKFVLENKRQPTDDEAAKIRAWVLENVRGTVQADILKEDQGQNTCIFSTEFSLKVMGDIAEYFVHHQVRNFYSVSISGYHIAEAGANPISQLAFTLSNGFTFVEAYLARGMHVDDFAPNLSFFFSNGMDPEYTVLGRVARRIWAVAMRDRYGANERSQKLKYHVQTSGRSLHAQEIQFNDIRTTLQALIAIYDNCNSLHTNAFDEAITTPTEESVRRAMAIQLIINREWGLAKNENPNQGAFILEELTDLVEEAVLKEFEAISERGGVLGAMETGYQRGKIQEESLYYEHQKHDGSYPIVGVNTFRNPNAGSTPHKVELARSTEEEKQSQLQRLADFHARHADNAPTALAKLRQTVIDDGNVFAELMNTVRVCSLGQITDALFDVGGEYRRSM